MIRKNVKGFTLIELMIVVAIIAIIAAIAIPSLLRSRIAANESSAVGTLRSFVTTEATWRQTDTDRNTLSDYWTADVSGFWRVERLPVGSGLPIAAMDVAIAQADCSKVGGAGAGAGVPAALTPTPPPQLAPAVAGALVPNTTATSAALLPLARDAAKSGYWFRVFDTDSVPTAYATDPDLDTLLYTNTGTFAFAAFPETYDTTGVSKFIVDQGGVIYGQDFGNNTPIFAWPGLNPTALGWRVVQ